MRRPGATVLDSGVRACLPVDQQKPTNQLAALSSALAQLDAAPCSVSDIVAIVPRLVCELGFDRALLSRIEDGAWTTAGVHIVGDPEWAMQIHAIGNAVPQKLVPGLLETAMVRDREALLVTDVQRDPRVHRRLAEATRSHSYVAAPIVSRGRVVGLLHADRYLQCRDITTDDKDLLIAFSHGVQLALSRATMKERIQAIEQRMSDAVAALRTAASANSDVGFGDAMSHAFDQTRASPLLTPSAGTNLTEREWQVFELMVEGKTNSTIAAELFIAESTVKRHVKHILRKLRARNRSEAIALWFQAQNSSRY